MPPDAPAGAAATQVAVTHGEGTVPAHEGQPATTYGADWPTAGAPEAGPGERRRRLGLAAVGAQYGARLREREPGHQVTSRAPSLTDTCGPVSSMVAPCRW